MGSLLHHHHAKETPMYECERMLGLDIPTQDDVCCDWCGDASDTPICVRCQEHHEQAHSDTVPPLIVKVVQVCGLWQGCAWLPSGVYLYTPAQYLSYADALHAAVALRY